MKKSVIITGSGKKCPKCDNFMERRKHSPSWISRKSFYYTEWDWCGGCKHIQHYEQFKSGAWREAEEQESFFNSLKN